MRRRARLALKAAVWLLCLTPLGALGWWTLTDDLTANPIAFVTDTLGDWTFGILLASLGMTPLRLVTGWGWPASLRRLLGLFAFFYATLHFAMWVLVDHFFNWGQMLSDVVKRPFITVGMLALALLVPLAATSTARMVKRLGARTWKRLHRLVYVVGVLAALHFLWAVKVGRTDQYLYAAVLAVLLGVRVWDAARRALRRRAAAAGALDRPGGVGAGGREAAPFVPRVRRWLRRAGTEMTGAPGPRSPGRPGRLGEAAAPLGGAARSEARASGDPAGAGARRSR